MLQGSWQSRAWQCRQPFSFICVTAELVLCFDGLKASVCFLLRLFRTFGLPELFLTSTIAALRHFFEGSLPHRSGVFPDGSLAPGPSSIASVKRLLKVLCTLIHWYYMLSYCIIYRIKSYYYMSCAAIGSQPPILLHESHQNPLFCLPEINW